MGRRVIDVFLSSTAMDLAEYRKAVFDELMSTGRFFCIRQEEFGSQNSNAVEFCRKAVRRADIFVGLVGLRRGWEPAAGNEKRSITEMEHDWARDAGRPRYLWVTPEDFPVPGTLHESDGQFARQQAFRKRVMAGGERIVSQKGFELPELLAGKIVKQLLLSDVTEELLNSFKLEPAPAGQPVPSKEEQAPAIAAAVWRLAEDRDVDLLALAQNPQGIDITELEAKLMAREKELEAEAHGTAVKRAEYWRHIGALAFLQHTHKALAAYRRAVSFDRDNADGWRHLGELLYRLGDYAGARTAFEELQELGRKTSNLRTQSNAMLRLNWIGQATGNLGAAEELANRALQLAKRAEWQEGMARAYGNLGVIHRTRGDLKRAEKMQLKELQLNEERASLEGMARARANLGSIYMRQGDLVRAEHMQLKALKLFEELGHKECVAATCGNLGLIYQARGDLDLAEEAQLKALKLSEELGRKDGMANAYGNLGLLCEKRGDTVRAEEMQLKALKLNRELGSKEGMASAYGNLGLLYEAAGDLDGAEEMQLRSLKLEEELGRKEGMAISYAALGNICERRGEFGRAGEMLMKSLRLDEELGNADDMAETYGNLCSVYMAQGDLDRAADMQLKALQLKSLKLHEAQGGEARAKGAVSGAHWAWRTRRRRHGNS